MAKDFYKILGIDKSASQDEIKKAFRKLAHQHHPDKAGGNNEKFKEINEAYQVLSNTEKRKQYDQFGSAAFEQGGGGAGGFSGNWQDFSQGGFDFSGFAGAGGFDFGDIFSEVFGGGRGGSQRSSRQKKGRDLEVQIQITFEEAAFGVEKEIELQRISTCEACSGNGGEKGSKIDTCAACNGHGQVEQVQQTMLGMMRSVVTCSKCGGNGKIYEKQCSHCGGDGTTSKKVRLKIKIPAGINEGETLRMTGEGEAGPQGSPAGDLYIHLRIKSHPHFSRNGYHVLSDLEIPYSLAVQGGKINANTLDGEVSVKIPEGTTAGTQLTLKGKGIKRLHDNGFGDHILRIQIHIPKKLSKDQKKALKDLEDVGL